MGKSSQRQFSKSRPRIWQKNVDLVVGTERPGREGSSESEQWLSVFMSVGVYFAPLAIAAGPNSPRLFSALVLDGRAVIKWTSGLPLLNNSRLMHGRNEAIRVWEKTEVFWKRREWKGGREKKHLSVIECLCFELCATCGRMNKRQIVNGVQKKGYCFS